jgi:hypothetical protein
MRSSRSELKPSTHEGLSSQQSRNQETATNRFKEVST